MTTIVEGCCWITLGSNLQEIHFERCDYDQRNLPKEGKSPYVCIYALYLSMYWLGSSTHVSAHAQTNTATRTLTHRWEDNHSAADITNMVQWSAVQSDSVKSKLYICAGNGWEWCRLHVLSAPLRHGNWSSVLLWVRVRGKKMRLLAANVEIRSCLHIFTVGCMLSVPVSLCITPDSSIACLSRQASKTKETCSKLLLLDGVWWGHGAEETDSMALIQQQPFRQWASLLAVSLWDDVLRFSESWFTLINEGSDSRE